MSEHVGKRYFRKYLQGKMLHAGPIYMSLSCALHLHRG
jgi:hypothetical protein